ncbi:hypothetical protein CUMW_124490 [Citrus unshiu]|nr:hypothetical protein CUMW_124490 [Citrus unshiu]
MLDLAWLALKYLSSSSWFCYSSSDGIVNKFVHQLQFPLYDVIQVMEADKNSLVFAGNDSPQVLRYYFAAAFFAR